MTYYYNTQYGTLTNIPPGQFYNQRNGQSNPGNYGTGCVASADGSLPRTCGSQMREEFAQNLPGYYLDMNRMEHLYARWVNEKFHGWNEPFYPDEEDPNYLGPVVDDPTKRSTEFEQCAKGRLDWLLNNTPHFADYAATFILHVGDAENTSYALLAVTMMNETFNPVFGVDHGPNTIAPNTPPNDWDYGPFQLNYQHTMNDLSAGSYTADEQLLRDAFGTPNTTLGTTPGLYPFANGRLAARKLNALTNAALGKKKRTAANIKNAEREAAQDYTSHTDAKRRKDREDSFNGYYEPFKAFFDCYKNKLLQRNGTY
jgi:hypothetical protein